MAGWKCIKFSFATETFVFLYLFVWSMHCTILPQLIVSKICSQYYNASVCSNLKLHRFKSEETRVYQDATLWNTITFICVLVPSLAFILPMGSLSDLIPKKKVMLVIPLLLMLQSTVYLMSAKFQESHLAFLALGSSLTGIFGDLQGGLSLANSLMAEMTTVGTVRTVRMTILTGFAHVGKGLGATFAGFLKEKYNFECVFVFSIIASALNLAYIIFVLPLTRKLHDTQEDGNFSASTVVIYTSEEATSSNGNYAARTENEKDANDATKGDEGAKTKEATITAWKVQDSIQTTKQRFTKTLASSLRYTAKSLRKIGGFILRYRAMPHGKYIWLLLVVYSLACCVSRGEANIIVLFIKHSPLSLNSFQVGIYLLMLFEVRGFGAIFLALLAKRLNVNDKLIVTLGFISYGCTFIVQALSTSKEELYYFTMLAAPNVLTNSGLRVMMTKSVDTDEAGIILSMCGFTGICADIIMGVTTNAVFRVTANFFPGLSILCLAAGSIIGLAILLAIIYLERKAWKKGYDDLDACNGKEQICDT
eukprot:Seg377.1 transcript_id=Seg377.1/GoldUCD/mRNA.D3Y31 product="Solute carrier family 46 member 3" protein_id=Seg377.1/GoldUCD/D3Y31